MWRLIDVAWFRPIAHQVPLKEAPLIMLVPLWILVLANLYFAFDTDLTVDIAHKAAAALIGEAP